jgi:signal transduction histidine kinase
MEAVVKSAATLCEAQNAQIFRVEDGVMRLVARWGPVRSTLEAGETRPITRASVSGRTIIDRATIHEPDLLAVVDEEYGDIAPAIHREGIRTTVGVPLLREGTPIGAITAFRTEVRPFTDKQVALLQTFAAQAVIAIQNVRLFNETRDALQQQTATAEILRVISRSPTDVQPVFEAIVTSGVSLFEGAAVAVVLPDDGQVRMAAIAEADPTRAGRWRERFPFPLTRDYMHGLAILDRRAVDVPDVLASSVVAEAGKQNFLKSGYRAITIMPMLREDTAIGAISVIRETPGPLSEKQLVLLGTFAEQAVIAIENVRLFKELEGRNAALTESLDQQTATSEILRVISSSQMDIQPVFEAIAKAASRLCGTRGAVLIYDGDLIRFAASSDTTPEGLAVMAQVYPRPADQGSLVGRAIIGRAVVHTPDVRRVSGLQTHLLEQLGIRAQVSVPMLRDGEPIGVIAVTRPEPGPFTDKQIALLKTFADQAVIAIENIRLFHEIQQKTRELEAANRHKDEFLASMSHELRTPLNAVIGFSEVLLERMFGELNAKQEEYLNDILASGRHLLSLINDILDLAKIEAGRMELELDDFELAPAIDNAVVLVRERATRKGLVLETALARDLGTIRADQRKVKQVLLNLLSNAVKFTPEGGRVEVRAQRVDGHVEVSVSDTGIGVAPEDQEAVFEEFRQVGTDYARKHEGTGLGLTLSRRFVELHGGHITLKSRLGEGSTFTFTLPVRR